MKNYIKYICILIALISLIIVGFYLKTHKYNMNQQMCEELRSDIHSMTSSMNERNHMTLKDSDNVIQLYKTYNEICNQNIKTKKDVKKIELSKKPCKASEQVLLQELCDSNNYSYDCFKRNLQIYEKLKTFACEEDKNKYESLIEKTQTILSTFDQNELTNKPSCKIIEENIFINTEDNNNFTRIRNIEKIINLIEFGCPQNKEKYQKMLNINLETMNYFVLTMDSYDVEKLMLLYKRLNLKEEAINILNKLESLHKIDKNKINEIKTDILKN